MWWPAMCGLHPRFAAGVPVWDETQSPRRIRWLRYGKARSSRPRLSNWWGLYDCSTFSSAARPWAVNLSIGRSSLERLQYRTSGTRGAIPIAAVLTAPVARPPSDRPSHLTFDELWRCAVRSASGRKWVYAIQATFNADFQNRFSMQRHKSGRSRAGN